MKLLEIKTTYKLYLTNKKIKFCYLICSLIVPTMKLGMMLNFSKHLTNKRLLLIISQHAKSDILNSTLIFKEYQSTFTSIMLGLESSTAIFSQYQEHIQSRNNLRFLIPTWSEMSTDYLQVNDWDCRAKLSVILRLVKLVFSTNHFSPGFRIQNFGVK